jgi:hypothetical protein
MTDQRTLKNIIKSQREELAQWEQVCYTLYADTVIADRKTNRANRILEADKLHVLAIQEGEKLMGEKYNFSTKSILELITEVQNALLSNPHEGDKHE